jgi:hypothetical protein
VVGAYCDDLVREGWLVDPVVYAPAAPDLRGVHTVGGDYREDELERAMARPRLVGDVVDTWARLAGGRRTVCFAVSIAHSEMIVAAFRKAGVPAEHLDGSTPRTLRDATLTRLRSGYTKLVSNCMVLTEGWDLPALEVAIVARPTASLNLHLQMLGRIMRAADGKAGSVVLDHAGNYGRHGLVTQRLTYSLEDRVRPDRPGEAPTKTCPECSMVVPAGTYECPGCGHQWARPPMPEHAAGDLEQVHGGDLKRPPLETQQAAWESIEARRVALGYREGWSQHVFRARFGFHPVVMQNRVIDQEAATPDDHVLVLRTFQDRAKQHGYKPGWAAHRYKEVFGRWPDPETKEAAQ